MLEHLGGSNLYFTTALSIALGINRRVELHVSFDSMFRTQHLQPSPLSLASSLRHVFPLLALVPSGTINRTYFMLLFRSSQHRALPVRTISQRRTAAPSNGRKRHTSTAEGFSRSYIGLPCFRNYPLHYTFPYRNSWQA